MICFQISIFEPLETTVWQTENAIIQLWFAFKLVSLNHWKQRNWYDKKIFLVVICFQISIFEPLETTKHYIRSQGLVLWFAFKLVSLNHWKQQIFSSTNRKSVVICFQISIFEPLETTAVVGGSRWRSLWFAFKLVSLNHWKQRYHAQAVYPPVVICFQISIFEPLETTISYQSPW